MTSFKGHGLRLAGFLRKTNTFQSKLVRIFVRSLPAEVLFAIQRVNYFAVERGFVSAEAEKLTKQGWGMLQRELNITRT